MMGCVEKKKYIECGYSRHKIRNANKKNFHHFFLGADFKQIAIFLLLF